MLLGVDGGGSKTALQLCTMDGRCIASMQIDKGHCQRAP